MAKDLVLFSSDSSELYKWDIYQALLLPHKSIIHFRYKNEYVDPTLLSDYKSLINREGIIFFTKGNDLSIPSDERIIEHISIRHVTIKEVEKAKNLNSLNFYLELGDFCDCQPIDGIDKNELPPSHFVSLITLSEGPNPDWVKRVDAVKDEFPNTLFYFIESIKQKGNLLEPTYSFENKKSWYEINDESDYTITLSLYNPNRENIRLYSESKEGLFETTINEIVPQVASIDTKHETITTHSLNKQKASACLRINQINLDLEENKKSAKTNNKQVELWFSIKRGTDKIWKFGMLSASAALGIMGTSVATKTPPLFIGYWPLVIGLGSLLLIGYVAAKLFDLFNKK